MVLDCHSQNLISEPHCPICKMGMMTFMAPRHRAIVGVKQLKFKYHTESRALHKVSIQRIVVIIVNIIREKEL